MVLVGEATGNFRLMGSRRGWWRMDRRGGFTGICIFIYWVPISWVARDARELVYASASWFMHQVDVRQAATGRMESAVEIRDNVAAFIFIRIAPSGMPPWP